MIWSLYRLFMPCLFNKLSLIHFYRYLPVIVNKSILNVIERTLPMPLPWSPTWMTTEGPDTCSTPQGSAKPTSFCLRNHTMWEDFGRFCYCLAHLPQFYKNGTVLPSAQWMAKLLLLLLFKRPNCLANQCAYGSTTECHFMNQSEQIGSLWYLEILHLFPAHDWEAERRYLFPRPNSHQCLGSWGKLSFLHIIFYHQNTKIIGMVTNGWPNGCSCLRKQGPCMRPFISSRTEKKTVLHDFKIHRYLVTRIL